MRSLSRILHSKADGPQFVVWILCIAWLVGSMALIIGLQGGAAEIPAICIFAIACVMWRGAYKLRGKKRHPSDAIGFLALAIWMVNLLGAFAFDYHRYVADLFFWASIIMLLLLILAAAYASGLAPRQRRRMKAALRIFG